MSSRVAPLWSTNYYVKIHICRLFPQYVLVCENVHCCLQRANMPCCTNNPRQFDNYWEHVSVTAASAHNHISLSYIILITIQITELKTVRGHMMPLLLHVSNGLDSPADAACHIYCEICDVICYKAALLWSLLEFSVVSCSLVCGTISCIK